MATVNGSMTVALVQATLAGTIYFILGVPGAAIWAAVTFITALVPVFGTFLVWGPIALYLALSGSPIKALVLVGWAFSRLERSTIFFIPSLWATRLRLHTVPTFFAILGGITLFGASGLILGPLVLAITIALIDVWWLRTIARPRRRGSVVENSMEEEPPGTVLQDHVGEDGRPV
jgi:predicted PurR-regulated permease PerM